MMTYLVCFCTFSEEDRVVGRSVAEFLLLNTVAGAVNEGEIMMTNTAPKKTLIIIPIATILTTFVLTLTMTSTKTSTTIIILPTPEARLMLLPNARTIKKAMLITKKQVQVTPSTTLNTTMTMPLRKETIIMILKTTMIKIRTVTTKVHPTLTPIATLTMPHPKTKIML